MSGVYNYLDENLWYPCKMLNAFTMAMALAVGIMSILNIFVFKSLVMGVYLFGFSVPVLIFALISLFMTIRNKKVIKSLHTRRR